MCCSQHSWGYGLAGHGTSDSYTITLLVSSHLLRSKDKPRPSWFFRSLTLHPWHLTDEEHTLQRTKPGIDMNRRGTWLLRVWSKSQAEIRHTGQEEKLQEDSLAVGPVTYTRTNNCNSHRKEIITLLLSCLCDYQELLGVQEADAESVSGREVPSGIQT